MLHRTANQSLAILMSSKVIKFHVACNLNRTKDGNISVLVKTSTVEPQLLNQLKFP